MNGQRCGVEWQHQRKGIAVSAVIHAVLIALALFLSVNYVKKAPALMTIFFDNERISPPRPEQAGGDGRKAGSEGTDKKAAKGAPKTIIKRVTRITDDTRQNLHPYPDATPKAASAAPAEIAPEPSQNSDHTLLKGNGEGFGGGGGRGVGAYGSGSGFGGTGKDGMGGGTGKGTGSQKADVERYLAEHYNYIKDLIQRHIVYPPMAKKMGWEGRVKVSFTISEKGAARKLKVLVSSGYRALDENLMETIKEVQPFPKPPAPADLDISITYSLDKT